MQPIKIFLASSGELRAERDGVFKIVADVNKLYSHLHLEIVEWETDLPSGNYDGLRIQDAINPLLSDCQIAYVLFFSKAGQFTIEELHLAQRVCPKVFVYFKTGFSTTDRTKNKLYDEVLEIREQLNKANQLIFKDYDGLTAFELHFKDDLHRYLTKSFPAAQQLAFGPTRTDLYHLPDLQPHFTGRASELQLLDQAWVDPNTHLVQFIAPGGTGKTMLVTYWLHHHLPRSPAAPPVAIYAWSFYSQGSDEGRQASSDLFFAKAAEFFGITALPTDPRERGRTLAARLRQERCLLILDGVEPLQYPPATQAGLSGKLKDPALAALLRELSFGQPGLCILTTRIAVTELEGIEAPQHLRRPLENFTPAEGAEFLKNLGVQGPAAELRAAAQEYRGHALALRLLGNYLVELLDGDVRRRDRIPHLTDEEQSGGHARRVMEAYVTWFVKNHRDAGQTGVPPELTLLRMMGLFDRPAPVEALDALCAAPDITGLTDGLRNLDTTRVRRAFQHLKKLGLLEENRLRPGQVPRPLAQLSALRELDSIDAHPLVREHFGQELEMKQFDAWREVNRRLYYFYRTLPTKQLPDTLAEMEPLFLAMAFGCRAGLQEEVRLEIFWERISRKKAGYSVNQLGAYGSYLAALAHLFKRVWKEPSQNMTSEGRAVVLGWAGFGLQGLGRLREAVEPMQAGLEMRKGQENWESAAIAASNLSELCLTLGAVSEAVAYGQQTVDFADRSGNGFHKVSKRTTLANALYQSGNLELAQHRFAEAEAMQRKSQPSYRFLYSLQGFFYCELLLNLGKRIEVLERVDCFFQWRMASDSLLSIALEDLSCGRAHAQSAGIEPTETNYEAAESYLNLAVEGLRKAGNALYLPKGLLARAHWRLQQNRLDPAAEDLSEVLEIAESGSMGLYLVDYHIGMARLRRLQGQQEAAEQHKAEALQRIQETGYFRRQAEAEAV